MTKNQRLQVRLFVLVGVMFCFAFAMVPFYKTLCRVAGLNNLEWSDADKLETIEYDPNRRLHIQFDSSVFSKKLSFHPLENERFIHPGEIGKIDFEVQNLTDKEIDIMAIPSFSPNYTGQYFYKIQCFCFEKQNLKPYEKRRLPLVFIIDSALPRETEFMVLSYTYFELSPSESDNI